MEKIVIKAERAGLGWHCNWLSHTAQGKSLSEALQRVISSITRKSTNWGREWSCPEAGMSGVIAPLRKGSRAEQPQMVLVGGSMK